MAAPERIRFQDEEQGEFPRRSGQVLTPKRLTDSLSIRRVPSQGSRDPWLTLPIQYRTV